MMKLYNLGHVGLAAVLLFVMKRVAPRPVLSQAGLDDYRTIRARMKTGITLPGPDLELYGVSN